MEGSHVEQHSTLLHYYQKTNRVVVEYNDKSASHREIQDREDYKQVLNIRIWRKYKQSRN